MNIDFSPEARLELLQASDWYETRRKGLGLSFENEVIKAAVRAAKNPLRWPIHVDDIRSIRLNKFLYRLYYVVLGQSLRIIAVAHLSRSPDYWRSRLHE